MTEIISPKQEKMAKLHDVSIEELKKQYTSSSLKYPPKLKLASETKYQKYIQVNYMQNQIYKISPFINSKGHFLRQQQNFRDYLLKVQVDSQRQEETSNHLKRMYFFGNKFAKPGRLTKKQSKLPQNSQIGKSRRQFSIQIFKPLKYLQQKSAKKARLFHKTRKNVEISSPAHMFSENIQSVKLISQVSDLAIPKSSSLLACVNNSKKMKSNPLKFSNQISNSISNILNRYEQYQNGSKDSKKFKNYQSKVELDKVYHKKVKQERQNILKIISKKQSDKYDNTQFINNHQRQRSLAQIPAKQKYAIDFISYVRKKTKTQLDKYMFQKLIKRPQKDLQKFQQFILKECKFTNQQNIHKMERIFSKMNEEFRRIEKYSQKGSKFDWRSQSTHLTEKRLSNIEINSKVLLINQIKVQNCQTGPAKQKSGQE